MLAARDRNRRNLIFESTNPFTRPLALPLPRTGPRAVGLPWRFVVRLHRTVPIKPARCVQSVRAELRLDALQKSR